MTPFAARVYGTVAAIPYGQTRTYKWVALKAGSAHAFRAVGNILNRNPYPMVIPCHRVVGSGGRLGGYVGGRKKKVILLNLERQIRESVVYLNEHITYGSP